MKFSSTQKVALITGANRKMVPANMANVTARVLAANGLYQVAVVNRSGADSLVQSISRAGGKAVSLRADVSDPAMVERLVADFRGLFDGQPVLDALVHFAGITGERLDTEAEPVDQFDQVMAIKSRGPWLLTKAVARHMAGRSGAIISTSSLACQAQLPYGPIKAAHSYVAVNAALEALTKCWAGEFGRKYGVRSNVIAPGPCHGEMVQSMGEDVLKSLRQKAILGDIISPEDVAALVKFLVSPEARFITGQVIQVNGGL